MKNNSMLNLLPLLTFAASSAVLLVLFWERAREPVFIVSAVIFSLSLAHLFFGGLFADLSQKGGGNIANVGVHLFFSGIIFLVSCTALVQALAGVGRLSIVASIVAVFLIIVSLIIKGFVKSFVDSRS